MYKFYYCDFGYPWNFHMKRCAYLPAGVHNVIINPSLFTFIKVVGRRMWEFTSECVHNPNVYIYANA